MAEIAHESCPVQLRHLAWAIRPRGTYPEPRGTRVHSKQIGVRYERSRRYRTRRPLRSSCPRCAGRSSPHTLRPCGGAGRLFPSASFTPSGQRRDTRVDHRSGSGQRVARRQPAHRRRELPGHELTRDRSAYSPGPPRAPWPGRARAGDIGSSRRRGRRNGRVDGAPTSRPTGTVSLYPDPQPGESGRGNSEVGSTTWR